jgi:hypothetical protein
MNICIISKSNNSIKFKINIFHYNGIIISYKSSEITVYWIIMVAVLIQFIFLYKKLNFLKYWL